MAEPPLVLIVDDEADTAAATAQILERAGYRTATAAEGQHALDLIRRRRPHVTLLETALPGLSGMEVLRRVRADRDLASCAVVMFSGRATAPDDQAAALDAGADAYITKPAAAQELLARVRARIRQRELTDALRASEARYADIVNTSHDLIWTIDAEGRITFVSPACRRIYGREPDEMIGRLFSDFVPTEDAARGAVLLAEIRAGADTFGFTGRVHAKDGREIILSSNVRVLRDAEGRVVGSTGISRDITEQERASERERALTQQLQEERARLVAAQAVAKVGSWHTDLTTMALTWSAETYRIFETDTSRFNQTYDAFMAHVHPDDRELVDRALRQSLNQPTPTTIEHRILLPDGRVKHVEERWLVSLDADGKRVATGTCRDITDQKVAEARIQHLNRVYAVLSGTNQVIFREKDADALLRAACRIAVEKGDFKMAWAALPDADGNLAIAAHAGAAPDTLLLVQQMLEEAAAGGRSSDTVETFMTGMRRVSNDLAQTTSADDEWTSGLRQAALDRGYRARASLPLIANGETLGVLSLYAGESGAFDDDELQLLDELAADIAFALDVYRRDAERQRTDMALRISEARLRASIRELHAVSTRLNDAREQERARMARDIHDHLGQSLTALKLDIAEVGRRNRSGESKAVEERLEEMNALIDTAINDVQRVAAELRPVILDDLGFVHAIEAYLRDVERRSHLRCVLDSQVSDVPIAADAATALFRILQEALTNVIRHAAARRVDVTLTADDEAVALVIQDDGVGIPAAEEVNPRAMGLVGMRDRARLFGGSVQVAGGPRGGTRVTARLPLTKDAP